MNQLEEGAAMKRRIFLVTVAVVLVAGGVFAQAEWEAVVGGGAAMGAGFGNQYNDTAESMAVLGTRVYVGTYDLCQVWRSVGGTTCTAASPASPSIASP